MSEFSRHFAAGQSLGERENQEDAFTILDLSPERHERLLFVLADGMGGHVGAADAAKTAFHHFGESARSAPGPLSQRLRAALYGANAALASSAARDETFKGAGCTLLAAAIEDNTLSWISVGDSSLFLFRDGKLLKLNDDHSMRPVLSRLVTEGRMTAVEAARDPRRHMLRSALTGEDIHLVDAPPKALLLKPDEAVILASDGLDTLSHRAIASVLKRTARARPVQTVEGLLKATRNANRRNQDNTTVIFYKHKPREFANSRHPWWRIFFAATTLS
jgi:serine/threonine protein phosphatase PrpC